MNPTFHGMVEGQELDSLATTIPSDDAPPAAMKFDF
jgi:hypothetical protein